MKFAESCNQHYKNSYLGSVMQVALYIALELLVERVYRIAANDIWHMLPIDQTYTNVFIDAWVGEGCFLAAVLTAIIVVSRFNRERTFFAYKGSILRNFASALIGLIIGFVLKLNQATLISHLYNSVYYVIDAKPYFPAFKEMIYCLAVAVTEETAFRAFCFQK